MISLAEDDDNEELIHNLVDPQILSPKISHHKYTPIDQLQPDTIVNIYGFVIRYTEPQMTRGTDMMVKISLVDRMPWNNELKLLLFRHTIEQLPLIQHIGDIVRCHRVKIQTYGGSLQGVRSQGFSCVVLSGVVGSMIEPRVRISGAIPKLLFAPNDLETITHLRKLSRAYRLQQHLNQEPNSSKCTSIKDLVIGSYVDVIGVVLAVLSEESSYDVMVLISDFTSHPLLQAEIKELSRLMQHKELLQVIATYGLASILSVMACDEYGSGISIMRYYGESLV
jgi:hypothetical protein